ncbi:unnamed protein product, partial [Heterosigma akashiwo]
RPRDRTRRRPPLLRRELGQAGLLEPAHQGPQLPADLPEVRPPGGVRLPAAVHDGGDVRPPERVGRRRRARLLSPAGGAAQCGPHLVPQALPRHLAGQQLPEQGAEAVHVHLLRVLRAAEDLGRAVQLGAHALRQVEGVGQVVPVGRRHLLGDAEVQQPDAPVLAHADVVALQVAVDQHLPAERLRVAEAHRLGHLQRPPQPDVNAGGRGGRVVRVVQQPVKGHLEAPRPFLLLVRLNQGREQILAGQPLQHKEGEVFVLAAAEVLDDVGVP